MTEELHELLKELLKELPCDYSAFIDVQEIDRRLKQRDKAKKIYEEANKEHSIISSILSEVFEDEWRTWKKNDRIT